MIKKLKKILICIFLIVLPSTGHCTKFDWVQLAYTLNNHPEQFDLTEVSGGTTNKNYHLKIANREFFVRMPLSQNSELGASLAREFQILDKIAHLEVSPRAFFYSDEYGVMITQYLHHNAIPLDFDDMGDRKILISLVKSIHESGVQVDFHFNPYETIKEQLYFVKSLDIELPECFEITVTDIIDACEKFGAFRHSISLCHHDIHPGNILKSDDRYFLVDWEYGAMSDPLYDIASIASIAFWDESQMLQFFKEYDDSYSEEDWQRVRLLRVLADIRWYLWCEIQKHLHPQDPIYQVWSDNYLEHVEQKTVMM